MKLTLPETEIQIQISPPRHQMEESVRRGGIREVAEYEMKIRAVRSARWIHFIEFIDNLIVLENRPDSPSEMAFSTLPNMVLEKPPK